MNITSKYCKKCYLKILSWGTMPSELYEKVCENYLIYGEPTIFVENKAYREQRIAQIINFMENNNYIVSTELGNKKLGVLPMIYQDIFCACKK